MNHIIVCRVNIPRELDPSNHVRPAPYKQDKWNEKRVRLLNQWTRASIEAQTCQDFTFVTFWGDHYPIDKANALDNELQLTVKRGVDEYDERAFDFEKWRAGENEKQEMDFAYQIRDLLKEHFPEGPYLFTNIDSDDCLKRDFVEILQREAPKYLDRAPYYLDVVTRYLIHLDTRGKGQKRRGNASPMVSTVEKELECYPLRYHHSMLDNYIDGHKVNGLYALQTVGDTNILTQGTGDEAYFKVSDYA